MTSRIKRLVYNDMELGDVVRCTEGVRGMKGKRFTFLGAVYESETDEAPAYLELVQIGKGAFRSIRPEFVVKDTKASKTAQARRKKKEADEAAERARRSESAKAAHEARKENT